MKYIKTDKSLDEAVQHLIEGRVFFENTSSGWKVVDGGCRVASFAMKHKSGNLHTRLYDDLGEMLTDMKDHISKDTHHDESVIDAAMILAKAIVSSSFETEPLSEDGMLKLNISINNDGKKDVASLREILERLLKRVDRIDRKNGILGM